MVGSITVSRYYHLYLDFNLDLYSGTCKTSMQSNMVPTCAPQGIPLAIHERISSRISPKILIGVFNSFISILQRFLQDIALMVPLALFKTFPYEYLQEFAQDSSRYKICEFCRQISRKCFLLHLLLSFSISYDTYPRTWVS